MSVPSLHRESSDSLIRTLYVLSWVLDYGNFKLTNQVARNEGSIFDSYLVSGIYGP